jgi:MYXO-CTERM domain-containing protein
MVSAEILKSEVEEMRARTLQLGIVLICALAASPAAASSSLGSAALKYEHKRGMTTSIAAKFPLKVLDLQLSLGVNVALDPVQDGGPLFRVDMPKGAMVEATWNGDKTVKLRPRTATESEGVVHVRHTIAPRFDFSIDGYGINAAFSLDTTSLLNKIPGTRFKYDSKADQAFAPWAFAPVETKVGAPDLENATLFSLDLEKIPQLASNDIEGYFGLKANTKPTFTYKTTAIRLSGADGEIHDADGELTVPAVDGDFMEVTAAVQGVMEVSGGIGLLPFVHIDKIKGFRPDTTLQIEAYNAPYTVEPTSVEYDAVTVHIPLPNVHVPAKGIDLGMVQAASKTIEIENTGEQEATMTFKSSDPAFAVPSETVTVPPSGKYELVVKFTGAGAGPALSEISVLSSDPDSPEQKIKIGANGADVRSDDEKRSGNIGPQDDSGCGCRATGPSSPVSDWAGLGFAGLGVVVLARRRRR